MRAILPFPLMSVKHIPLTEFLDSHIEARDRLPRRARELRHAVDQLERWCGIVIYTDELTPRLVETWLQAIDQREPAKQRLRGVFLSLQRAVWKGGAE